MQRTEIERVLRQHPAAVFSVRNGAAITRVNLTERSVWTYDHGTEWRTFLVGTGLYRDDEGRWEPMGSVREHYVHDVDGWTESVDSYNDAWRNRYA